MQDPCTYVPRTLAYGQLPDQVGDLYLPVNARPTPNNLPSGGLRVICLLHGGFWRLPWARDSIAPIAVDLARRGFAVWNLEYRRVGDLGGGWSGTLDDVTAGIDYLAFVSRSGIPLDTRRVMVVGHSAGGQLALWSARRDDRRAVRITAVAGLAAVADLVLAYELKTGNGAVNNFLGGTPHEYPQRYRAVSPAAMLPLGVKQLLIHGTHDEDVPVEMSRRYAKSAATARDDLTFVELATAAHMDSVDPTSESHAVLCGWLEREGASA